MRSDRWQALGVLVDPVRRALFDFVRRQDHAVTREEAADARSISRNLTAFHLDKLVEAGLLRTWFPPRTGRPRGRGRTAKVYEPVDAQVVVSIPERRYELVGQILADAVADEPGRAGEAALRHAHLRGRRAGQRLLETRETAAEALAATAADQIATPAPTGETTTPAPAGAPAASGGTDGAAGRTDVVETSGESGRGAGPATGVALGTDAGPDTSRDTHRAGEDDDERTDGGVSSSNNSSEVGHACAVLGELGFEPHRTQPGRVLLGNCPFHTLAVQQPELVCGLNQAFIAGLLDGLRLRRLRAELAPQPGACCVELHAEPSGAPG